MRWTNAAVSILSGSSLLILGLSGTLRGNPEEETIPSQRECTFTQNPDEFLSAQARAYNEAQERIRKFSGRRAESDARNIAASEVPRKNFIDEEIFGRMAEAGVASAPLTSDLEFVRRIYLDLTGRIPTRDQIREFTSSDSASKRDDLIDRLLSTPEFTDKWTMWMGDWLGNNVTLSTAANQRMVNGRNAFFDYIKDAVYSGKSIRDLAYECVTGTGSTFDVTTGAANFPLGASAAMGPVQDTWDLMLFKTASTFLGLGHYDCLACHNGRGHLDQISLWGRNTTRMEAWRMAAFFSRMRFTRDGRGQYSNPYYNNIVVSDATAGDYPLNTTGGNRPARCKNNQPVASNGRCVATDNLKPEYRLDGATPADGNWRGAFAQMMVDDPLFARNFVNRMWKQFFTVGLVDPVDTLDPARLDPANPPPAPWTFQASHPMLLERLGLEFHGSNYSLREIIRFIVSSNAYQLSSRYEGEWKYEYIQLFARHFPRRLEAEEVHDAIAQSTGMLASYTWSMADGQTIPRGAAQPQSEPVLWAMQLPDTVEPRNNAAPRNFLNAFLRGNRDTATRHQAGSILQRLSLMNDRFVTTRVKVAASPVLRELRQISDNNELVTELFLNFLSRPPSARELAAALAFLEKSPNRNTAVEDLSWAAINKVDFLYSY